MKKLKIRCSVIMSDTENDKMMTAWLWPCHLVKKEGCSGWGTCGWPCRWGGSAAAKETGGSGGEGRRQSEGWEPQAHTSALRTSTVSSLPAGPRHLPQVYLDPSWRWCESHLPRAGLWVVPRPGWLLFKERRETGEGERDRE